MDFHTLLTALSALFAGAAALAAASAARNTVLHSRNLTRLTQIEIYCGDLHEMITTQKDALNRLRSRVAMQKKRAAEEETVVTTTVPQTDEERAELKKQLRSSLGLVPGAKK